jgi:hypothetical protein
MARRNFPPPAGPLPLNEQDDEDGKFDDDTEEGREEVGGSAGPTGSATTAAMTAEQNERPGR